MPTASEIAAFGSRLNTGDVHGPAGPKTDPEDATGWTTLNALSTTFATSARDNSVCMKMVASAGNSFTARVKAAPSTPYTAIAGIRAAMAKTDNNTFGLLVWDGTNAVAMQLVTVSGSFYVYVQLSSSFNLSGTVYLAGFPLIEQPPFLAIRDDGTDRKYYIGVEEENMLEIFSHARTTGVTPTHIGWFGNPRHISVGVKVTLFSWRDQSAAPG